MSIRYNKTFTHPVVIGWYKHAEKQWTHQYNYRMAIMAYEIGQWYRKDGYNSVKEAADQNAFPTMLCMQTNAPVSVTNGAFGIELEIMQSQDNQYKNRHTPYGSGGDFVQSWYCELCVGDKYWNGNQWDTTHSAFTIGTAGSEKAIYVQGESQPDEGAGNAYNTRDIDTQPEQQVGHYVPVPAGTIFFGKVSLKIYADLPRSRATLITKCHVKFYPTQPAQPNPDAYVYTQVLNSGKQEKKEVSLNLCTRVNYRIGNNLLFANDGNYAKLINFDRGDHGAVNKRIEDMLLLRMAAVYSAPQETIKVTVRDDGNTWYYNAPVVFNGSTWALLAKSINVIDNEITLTLQKLDI